MLEEQLIEEERALNFSYGYLSVWVAVCMILGTSIGYLFPNTAATLGGIEVAPMYPCPYSDRSVVLPENEIDSDNDHDDRRAVSYPFFDCSQFFKHRTYEVG